ncbi:MAG TPA: S-layer homology domain-containing protein [Syntrophomonas sp.]|nr:S-layer homology domain-containing protein [Syntrophomonas sp.]
MKRIIIKLCLLVGLLLGLALLWLSAPAAAASADDVTVRIVGTDSLLLDNFVVDRASLTSYLQSHDLTPDDADPAPNALDAVLYASLHNGYDEDSYEIAYLFDYGAYFIRRIAGVKAEGSDYWGSLAVNSEGGLDGGSLCAHAVQAGDTYIVYYDQYTGTGANYGNQAYACFRQEWLAGETGATITVDLMTAGYDEGWNTVAVPLAGATIYASGADLTDRTAVAVTDSAGQACLSFAAAGTYLLYLSGDYTYTQCTVTIDGSNVTFHDVEIRVTDGSNLLPEGALLLTDDDGKARSPWTIASGAYTYRLPGGTYHYAASASGCRPASGAIEVSGDSSQDLSLTPFRGHAVTITLGAATESVRICNSSGVVQNPLNGADRVFTYDLVDGDYAYTVKRSGYHSTFGRFSVNGAAQSLTLPALTEPAGEAAEWPAFRDFSDNMASTASAIAQGAWQAEEQWSVSLGAPGPWGTLTTSNLILYDGYLYAATEHGLSKLDRTSGKVFVTSALSADASYVSQIAYGDGRIFVTTAAGVEAFDALTMESLWSCSDFDTFGSSYMATTPLLYDNGTVYVGTYGCSSGNNLGTYGGYAAIGADDGRVLWTAWGGEHSVFYGAGAVRQGDYLIYGGDDGVLRAIDLAKVETNAYHSLTTAPLQLPVNGAVRASVARAGEYLYLTTNSGYLYKIALDEDFKVENAIQFAPASTSTPLLHNGKIYVGASDGIYVFNGDDFTQLYHFPTTNPVQSSALLNDSGDGKVYAYFTVNSAQGEILVLTDEGTELSCTVLYQPSPGQYCLNSLVADPDGVLYYSNDTGRVLALGNNHKPQGDWSTTTINITPSAVYEGDNTLYPTIKVITSSDQEIPAVAGHYYLIAGNYRYNISLNGYLTAWGTFTVSADDAAVGSKEITVVLTKSSDSPSEVNLTVDFSLQDVSAAFRRTITVAAGSTVYDVFIKAMNATGVDYTIRSGSYIEIIDGLAEGDRGANSGWMFTVNGNHPVVGIAGYHVKSGDEIVFHYSSDYTREEDGQDWQAGDDSAENVAAITNDEPVSVVFSDVEENAWYYTAVNFVNKRGLFGGTEAQVFAPDWAMTRAMLVMVLARLDGTDLTAFHNPAFTDTQDDAWYAAAVAWSAARGIVAGMGDGCFAPDQEITREQMCVLLIRYCRAEGIPLPEAAEHREFADDHAISDWSRAEVAMARHLGLIEGKIDNCFDPQGYLTRAEAATIFMRFVQKFIP